MNTILQHQGLSTIIDKYDVLFVDLWGVIHDGIEAYPGITEALISLQEAEKKVIFISNAPRRAFKAIEGLQKLGIPDGLYDAVITSGEVVYQSLVGGSPFIVNGNSGKRFIIIGPERDACLLDGTDYIKVMDVKDADFMIVTGFDNDDSTMEEKQHYLDEAIKLNLPLICANPDLVIVRISGKRALCAGAIAIRYIEMGGRVIQFGKPYRQVYLKAMELAGSPAKERVAAIGDSMLTDIKGAKDFGIDSYLIPGGIHGKELAVIHAQLPDTNKMQDFCNKYNIYPTGILPEFSF